MVLLPANHRSSRKARRLWIAPLIEALTAYRNSVRDSCQEEIPDGNTENTLIALILKACFLKLAHERKILSVGSPALFADLMKLRRRTKRPDNQMELWMADQSRVAVDTVLENLELDNSVVAKAQLRKLHEILWGAHLDGHENDLLGTIYQELVHRGDRKRTGQFYTPPEVVDSILDYLPLDPIANPKLTVLDPACGSGQFLLRVYDQIKQCYIDDGWETSAAHKQILENHIYGFDIDPYALVLTKMNLMLKERINEPIHFHLHALNPLKRAEQQLFYRVTDLPDMTGCFSVVVGNPPWGSKLTKQEKTDYRSRYQSAASGVNSFSLFLERSLELVCDKGIVAFLIPEAYLNIRAHQASRQLLLEKAAVHTIATCGELFEKVFAPAIIIITRREADEEKRSHNPIHVVQRLGSADERRSEIPQAAFEETPENIFNVHLDDHTRGLLTQIGSDCANLKGNALFGLGLVTGDNSRFVADHRRTSKYEPIIIGKDVERFRINYSGNWIEYNRDALQQACPREIFDAPLKLVYRFIGKTLVFACDDKKRFTLNNANVLVPHLPGFRIHYLLALLNSSVMQFYYTFNFFTVKVLRGNLERLPLKWIPEPLQKEIESAVLSLRGKTGTEFIERTLDIDRMVYEIYGIEDTDREWIRNRLIDELGPGAAISYTQTSTLMNSNSQIEERV